MNEGSLFRERKEASSQAMMSLKENPGLCCNELLSGLMELLTACRPPQLAVRTHANMNPCSAKNNTYKIAMFEISPSLEMFLGLVILLL